MALPKGKISKARGRKRRTHWKLSLPTLAACPQCKQMRLAHRVCQHCGFYNGVEVVKMDLEKKRA